MRICTFEFAVNGTSPLVIVSTPFDAVKTIELVTGPTPTTEYVQVARYVPSGKTLLPVVIETPATIVVQPSNPDEFCGAAAPSDMDMIGAGVAAASACACVAADARSRAAAAALTADPVATSTS
jgi:hypothetical protein